jgi:uncharacterized LabA/DUF88 family protein
MRIAVLIDGGHLRVLAAKAKQNYSADFIEKIGLSVVLTDERLLRVMYYDCAPYSGTVKSPVSGKSREFKGDDTLLRQVASRDQFAVRRGILKFRGWKPKNVPIPPSVLTDSDFGPDFEQKGVDMRIGLDVAHFCTTRAVERIVMITNDTDFVPAMKYARIAGLQIVVGSFPQSRVASELLEHADFKRPLAWP